MSEREQQIQERCAALNKMIESAAHEAGNLGVRVPDLFEVADLLKIAHRMAVRAVAEEVSGG